MEILHKSVDIRICGSKPFIYKLEQGEKIHWNSFIRKLATDQKDKKLNISSDGYITETDGQICFCDFLNKKNKTRIKQNYISHVIYSNGRIVDLNLDSILPLPKIINNNIVSNYRMKRLIAGHQGSGTALHSHSRACFVNLAGKKKWFLAEPSIRNQEVLDEFKYNIEDKKIACITDWFHSRADEFAAQLNGCEIFTLKEHEALFIPDGYLHAVLNLETTIGVAFSWEEKCQNLA